jgi:dynein heavy chain 1
MLTPHFKGLADDLRHNEEKWVNMFENSVAETMVPEPWFQEGDISTRNEVARILKKMMIIKVVRPDRFLASAAMFVEKVLGTEITSISQVDLIEFSKPHISPKNPIMLVSAPGYDASFRVDTLAK